MEIANLFLNIVLIALLGVMIFFVMRLHKRLEIIRSGKNDLEGLLQTLVTSTANAEIGLKALRKHAEELTDTLGKQVTGADNAKEELSYLLTSSERTAGELLKAVEQAKQAATAIQVAPIRAAAAAATAQTVAAVTPASVNETPKADVRRTAEDDLLKAIEKLR